MSADALAKRGPLYVDCANGVGALQLTPIQVSIRPHTGVLETLLPLTLTLTLNLTLFRPYWNDHIRLFN